MDGYIVFILVLIVMALLIGYVPLYRDRRHTQNCLPCTARRIEECMTLLLEIRERLKKEDS